MALNTAVRVAVAIAIIIIVIAAIAAISISQPKVKQTTTNSLTNVTDEYANLGTASFALVAQRSVMQNNQKFVSRAERYYDFKYSNASDFTGVENSMYIILVVNATEPAYLSLAQSAVNATELNYAINDSTGIVLTGKSAWPPGQSPGQTVFVLAGYKNDSSLSAALDGFFIKPNISAPKQVMATFYSSNIVNSTAGYSGADVAPSISTGVSDPVMDAYYQGYELSPRDSSLSGPYAYYLNFAYLLYAAPESSQYVWAHGNATGYGLPMSARMCTPKPPPIPGSSVCFGEYLAMPMFQFEATQLQAPEWNLQGGGCNYAFFNECIDASGWAASGVYPPTPSSDYQYIPSVFYGFSHDSNPVPPSMTGAAGPTFSSAPTVWSFYGPSGVTTVDQSTGISNRTTNINDNLSIMYANVSMFSTPLNETPLGNFSMSAANNSTTGKTYSCKSNKCGMRFNYGIYAFVNVTNDAPPGAISGPPPNNTAPSYHGYYPVLYPITLSTPKVLDYGLGEKVYFSYWGVYSELNGTQYYQRLTTSNSTLQVIGPTQAEAIYTTAAGQGRIEGATKGYSDQRITGVNVLVTNYTSGANVATLTSNATGWFSTALLDPGCYNVSASKPSYFFVVIPNPVCIYGNVMVNATDPYPFIYLLKWPDGYNGGAPPNTSVALNLTVLTQNWFPWTDENVTAYTNSGNITNSSVTSGSGTSLFLWHSGSKSGNYYINFTVPYFNGWPPHPHPFKVPVMVYSKNYTSSVLINLTLSNGSVKVMPGGKVSVGASVKNCQFTSNYSVNSTPVCDSAWPANLSITGVPSGVNAVFSINPVPAVCGLVGCFSSLNISVGSGSSNGVYNLTAYATVHPPNSQAFSKSALLKLSVRTGASCSGDFGGIDGVVFGSNGNPEAANVTVTNNTGATYYKNYTGSGDFSTGNILPSGGYYNITAYQPSSATMIGTNRTYVSPCETSHVRVWPAIQINSTGNYTFNGTSTTGNAMIRLAGGYGYYICTAGLDMSFGGIINYSWTLDKSKTWTAYIGHLPRYNDVCSISAPSTGTALAGIGVKNTTLPSITTVQQENATTVLDYTVADSGSMVVIDGAVGSYGGVPSTLTGVSLPVGCSVLRTEGGLTTLPYSFVALCKSQVAGSYKAYFTLQSNSTHNWPVLGAYVFGPSNSTKVTNSTAAYACGHYFGCLTSAPPASYCPSNCPVAETQIQGCTVGHRSYWCQNVT